jgi:hypothetical protein
MRSRHRRPHAVRGAMHRTRAIPSTRSGRAYRVLLVVGGLLAVVGIADAARALFWMVLTHAAGEAAPAIGYVSVGLRLVAWGLVALAAYTGWRRNVIPPTWLLLAIPVLSWALIIVQRYTP